MSPAAWVLLPALALSLWLAARLSMRLDTTSMLRVELSAWAGMVVAGLLGLGLTGLWTTGLAQGELMSWNRTTASSTVTRLAESPTHFWINALFHWIVSTGLLTFSAAEWRRWRQP